MGRLRQRHGEKQSAAMDTHKWPVNRTKHADRVEYGWHYYGAKWTVFKLMLRNKPTNLQSMHPVLRMCMTGTNSLKVATNANNYPSNYPWPHMAPQHEAAMVWTNVKAGPFPLQAPSLAIRRGPTTYEKRCIHIHCSCWKWCLLHCHWIRGWSLGFVTLMLCRRIEDVATIFCKDIFA